MKRITVYECADGKRFDDLDKANEYDNIFFLVEDVLSKLGTPLQNGDLNSEQRDEARVRQGLSKLMEICKQAIPYNDKWFDSVTIENCRDNYVERILGDYQHDYPCLFDAYYRFCCISPSSFIEYKQPYYAKHEEEFEQMVEKYKEEIL